MSRARSTVAKGGSEERRCIQMGEERTVGRLPTMRRGNSWMVSSAGVEMKGGSSMKRVGMEASSQNQGAHRMGGHRRQRDPCGTCNSDPEWRPRPRRDDFPIEKGSHPTFMSKISFFTYE